MDVILTATLTVSPRMGAPSAASCGILAKRETTTKPYLRNGAPNLRNYWLLSITYEALQALARLTLSL